MNTQVPKAYIISVVAFALAIPLWILAVGPRSGSSSSSAGPVIPDPPPKPVEKEYRLQLLNESDFIVVGTLTWQVPDPAKKDNWRSITRDFSLPPKTGKFEQKLTDAMRNLEISSSAQPAAGSTFRLMPLGKLQRPVIGHFAVTYYQAAPLKPPLVRTFPN